MGRGGEQQQSSKFFFTEGPLPGLSGTQEVFAGGLLGLICGYYFVLIPALLGVAAYAWLARSTIVAAGLVAFVSSAAWPARTAVAPTPVAKSWLWLWWCRYFTLETVVEEPLDAANRPHIFASFPHGMFPIGPWLSLGVASRALPGARMCGVLASVLLRTPLLRHLYFSLGLRAADSKSIKHIITREHASCQIIVGGIAEMFMADDPRYERVYLRRRTGFVRLAIKNGTPLVPVFYFGASRTLSKFSPAWLEQVSRKLKISLLGFYGRWYVPVPYARPIKMAVGRAIEVPAPAGENGEPSDEQVREMHAVFMRELEALYARHRPEWEKRELRIE